MTTLTSERLSRYTTATNGNIENALSLYEDNTRISEAFYTPLQSLEVCLRNTLHRRMANSYGEDWFHSAKVPLTNESRILITEAERALATQPLPLRPGSVVAELKFGFWVGLLGKSYDATIWRLTLFKGFTSRGGQKRAVVHGRFNAIRRFRNRIAHHEPIIHRPLVQLHEEMIEAVAWMCADTSAWTAHMSRVPDVLSAAGIKSRPE